MQGAQPAARHGLKLLGVKLILGIAAAFVAMAILRLFGGSELIVALCIGLVPGIAERSARKIVGGALLAVIGYQVGAHVGLAISKSASGVPLGHWAITGAFIGMTAGIRRFPGQAASSRITGGASGFILGLIFGIFGDIAGFLTISAPNLPLFYYLREVSLLCAGFFINFACALATMLAMVIARRSRGEAVAVQEAQA
ncbi:MAG: hypothetical protein C4520_13270 [Candidatus Abyssobacteria bacterium SURF_5]|uniref:Uncharacterized protein n=1 Tax=Abyssobacteria bacterium (strain SURF_5) TaxID=2093360 RepID=A0A3A4NKT4_ABYX5|nr:MAG: hypothetical protein C4520_13270 [Candidatus Abyssubacteria bacterium SURF_5]